MTGEGTKLIVGFDGTPQAHDALVLGSGLAATLDAGLHVAVVVDDDNLDSERARFERLFGEVIRQIPGVEFEEHRLHDGSASDALSRLSERTHPGAVVIGSSHRSGLGQTLLGGVGERLLNGSPAAVLVAPRGYAEREHFGAGLIGVAFDGGPEALRALDAGVKLAGALGVSLRVISVLPDTRVPSEVAGGELGAQHPHRDALEAQIRTELERLPRVKADSIVASGDVVDELAEQAVELDLLVAGSRSYGPVRRVLLGGVSTALARACPCPLLVLPRSSSGWWGALDGSPDLPAPADA